MNQNLGASGGGFNFSRILWAVKSRLGIILICFALATVAGYFASSVVPKYKASAQILFDPSWTASSEPALVPAILNLKALERAIALVQSPQILRQVALKIISQDGAKNISPDSSIQNVLHSNADDELRLRRLMARLGKSLKVSTEAADQIIIVDYQSESPQEAAYIANLMAHTFVEDRTAERKAALSEVTDWLDRRVVESKEKLVSIEKKIHDYQAEHKIYESGSSEYDNQLSHLREQLSLLQVNLSNAESLYRALQPYKDGGSQSNAKLAEVVNDEALQKLRATLTEAESQEAAAKSKFGPYHPDVQAKQAQVQVIRQEIGAEARRKLASTMNLLNTLHNQEKDLRERIDAIELKVNDVRASEVPLRELQRERDATKTLYEASLLRLTQAAPQQARSLSEFKVLLDASVPEAPKIPPMLIWLAVSLAGLAAGLGASVLLDYFNDKLVHIDGLEQALGIHVLACVPLIKDQDLTNAADVKGERRNSLDFFQFAKDHPESLFTNCLMNAKVAIAGQGRAADGNVVMITSPMQGDGKTHLSTNLASLSTLLGKKTLYIDLDSRKGTRSGEAGPQAQKSKLGAFLDAGRLSQIVIAADSAGQYDVVRPAASEEAAWMQFFRPQMTELLEFARKEYDQVWIDTPPVQMFADALMLAKQVDGVIIVAEWSKTTKKELISATDLIRRSGGKVMGVLINKVKVDILISRSMAYYKKYYASPRKLGLI